MIHTNDTDDGANCWPALIDLVTSVLIVFLFSTVVQDYLSLKSFEAMRIQAQQQRFLQVFDVEFANEIAKGIIHVAFDPSLDYMQITFSDRVLFDSGEYQLLKGGRMLLERCAQVLAQSGESGFRLIQVEGHTDNIPIQPRVRYPTNNWELSAARAISVVQFLSVGRGLPQEVFSANGYAYFRPVKSNTSEVGRARNRRIEIRVFFAGQRSPAP